MAKSAVSMSPSKPLDWCFWVGGQEEERSMLSSSSEQPSMAGCWAARVRPLEAWDTTATAELSWETFMAAMMIAKM